MSNIQETEADIMAEFARNTSSQTLKDLLLSEGRFVNHTLTDEERTAAVNELTARGDTRF